MDVGHATAYVVVDVDTQEFYSHLAGTRHTYFTSFFAQAYMYATPQTARKKADVPRNRVNGTGNLVPRDLRVFRVHLMGEFTEL